MSEIEHAKICTLIASRGLVHSRTMECILDNLEDLELISGPHWIIFSHDRKIPDAQNYLVSEGLTKEADYFWFVEEDMTFPPDTLFRMLAEQMPVVVVDYPVGEKAYSTIMEKNKEIWWAGMGCMLVARSVFEDMKAPWFQTDTTWRITNPEKMELVEEKIANKYGGHDINFGMRLKKLGIPITCLKDVTAGHLEVVYAPKKSYNDGTYTIIEHNEIKNYQRY